MITTLRILQIIYIPAALAFFVAAVYEPVEFFLWPLVLSMICTSQIFVAQGIIDRRRERKERSTTHPAKV